MRKTLTVPPSITDDETIVRLTHHLPDRLERHALQALSGIRHTHPRRHPLQFRHQSLIQDTCRGVKRRWEQKERSGRLAGRRFPLMSIHDFEYFRRASHQDFRRVKILALGNDALDGQGIFSRRDDDVAGPPEPQR